MSDFPDSLFDERLRRKLFGDTVDTDSDMQVDFIGRPNPDYDPDYIPPDDLIPF